MAAPKKKSRKKKAQVSYGDEYPIDLSEPVAVKTRTVEHRPREISPVRAILAGLRMMGFDPVKNHGSRYSRRGRPDIEVLVKFPGQEAGTLFAIEVKRPGGVPTEQQVARLDRYRERGAVAFVAHSWADVRQAIANHRERLEGGES